jgi:uncharacterized protein
VPAWTVYLASDDADATADAVSAPGGPVLMGPGPGDVGPVGQMFVAADPAEAVFGVWQHGEHIGAGVVNEPGGLVWEDTAVPDPDAIRPFSAAVFGYRYDPTPGAGTDYTTFTGAEPYPLGGIGGVVPGSPPHWPAYLLCRGLHRCRVAATERAGGTVVRAATDSPYGRSAVLADATQPCLPSSRRPGKASRTGPANFGGGRWRRGLPWTVPAPEARGPE